MPPLPAPAADLYRDMMTRFLGPVVMGAIDDADVVEVYTNPHDQRIWTITHSAGRLNTGARIDPSSVLSFLHTVATSLRTTLDAEHPKLQAELPLGPSHMPRLQGLIPPRTEGPCFVIRKHAPEVYSLDQLVVDGVLTRTSARILREAVRKHWNVLVVGGPRTGKTTLVNSVLREITHQFPHERLLLIEDTLELQCAGRDRLALRVREGESLAEPTKEALRLSPDRLAVGEVRDHAAYYMLDAWLSVSPGSVATLHGSSPENALLRLDLLCQRAGVPSQMPLIGAAVQLVVYLEREQHVRPRVTEIVRVNGLDVDGRLVLHPLIPSGAEAKPFGPEIPWSKRPVPVGEPVST